MRKPFEKLCLLVDQFYSQIPYEVKQGRPQDYGDDYYLKLYWYGLLEEISAKYRFYPKAVENYPSLFKKTFSIHYPATIVAY